MKSPSRLSKTLSKTPFHSPAGGIKNAVFLISGGFDSHPLPFPGGGSPDWTCPVFHPWDMETSSDLKNISLSLIASCKLTGELSVGAGLRGEVATAKFNTVPGPVDVRLGCGEAYGGGFNLGPHRQAREDLALGLAYRSPSWFGALARPSPSNILPILTCCLEIGEYFVSD